MKYSSLAIPNQSNLIFGTCNHPITTRRGLVIGGGKVHPELNFTVPPMHVNESTFPEVKEMYRSIIDEACKRAIELDCEGFVAEYETLPEMTITPHIAIDITAVISEVMDHYHASHGLKTALRVTPNDTREMKRPPILRSGEYLDNMLKTFQGCAKAGADFLAIESTGGKEIHDEALMTCDIAKVIFALGILGSRDMEYLWKQIVSLSNSNGSIPSGDTACGFGNTAMMLADKKFIPKVFAAVVRAITAVRSLVAYEQGAVGPGKDCGYENIIIKAITGFPMAMEGKTAACAHLSPVGNVSAAACDLWSNESVQNIKLLGGFAPTVYLEQLIYDCRLMNQSTIENANLTLRNLLVNSDINYDPQAYILSPDSAIRIAQAIVDAPDHYSASKAAGLTAIDILVKASANGLVKIPDVEAPYLEMMSDAIRALPDSEEDFISQMIPMVDSEKCRLEEYQIKR